MLCGGIYVLGMGVLRVGFSKNQRLLLGSLHSLLVDMPNGNPSQELAGKDRTSVRDILSGGA